MIGRPSTGHVSKYPVRLTVIIPTRDRCDTLGATLRSCLDQNYDNYEIIVSDNCSTDRTREVVAAVASPRVRYINTGRRLSMSGNWEFALTHVADGYLTVIGDDDALLPGSLAAVNNLLCETSAEAIVWKKAEYSWPDCIDPDWRNILAIPLGSSVCWSASFDMLRQVAHFKCAYDRLPSLYNSFVRNQAVRQVTQRSGRFFHSSVPDVYSAVALAMVIERYIYSWRPYTVNGHSRHSTGMSALYPAKGEDASRIFYGENDIPFHKQLALAPSMAIIQAESFLQACEQFGHQDALQVNLEEVIRHAVQDAVHRPALEYDRIVDAVRQIGAVHRMECPVELLLNHARNRPHRQLPPVPGINLVRNHAVLPCDDCGVRDVQDAAILCRHFLALVKASYWSVRGLWNSSRALAHKEILKRL